MAFDVRRFDIYRKIPKDLTQPTLTGAVISVCCCCFICILFISEFLHFINVNVILSLPQGSEGVNIYVALFSYTRAFEDGHRNFEPWSNDKDGI
ncbi:endoplasmic reticulum-Golgi intermediate compartment protein 1 [Trichonephila clavata]|uniref:Endoplasmic reticulum-Golgi intermediate compartment protein 1 n=1 Tax=Trichonephila clavata TaxID=2740835 RepID=A0A8X6FRY0_TRICU|nr:endoplasmic reticulum-Golgi intermediate compartment protein 1 [Trichonephila clavata]